jgi:hypothetical protein
MTPEEFVEKWAYRARTKQPTMASDMIIDLHALLAQREREVREACINTARDQLRGFQATTYNSAIDAVIKAIRQGDTT